LFRCKSFIALLTKSKKEMKNLFILAIVAGLFAACGGPKGKKAETGEAQEIGEVQGITGTYAVNTSTSNIAWVGYKFAYQHNGTVNVKEGSLEVKDNNLVGGSVVIDMNTIDVLDLTDEKKKSDFLGHMTTDDFFTTDSFPTAEFKLASLEAIANATADSTGFTPTHKVSGNLTIKGITKSITMDAKVTVEDSKIIAETAQFLIDRTQWNIVFSSASAVENLAKDKIIKDEIGISLKLEADKKEETAAAH